jgi:hypothetical protein
MVRFGPPRTISQQWRSHHRQLRSIRKAAARAFRSWSSIRWPGTVPSEVLSATIKDQQLHAAHRDSAMFLAGLRQVLHVVPEAKAASSQAISRRSGTTIENAALRVTVDPKTGCITSLFDKKANFETDRRREAAATSCRPSKIRRRNTTRGTSIPAPRPLHAD